MLVIFESVNTITLNKTIKLLFNECNRLLSITKYGWYNFKEKKEILPNSKEWKIQNYFEDNCRILEPAEVLKYKIGTCWDFSIYIANYLKTISQLDSDIYFINDSEFKMTHTFVVFKSNNQTYIIEPTINKKNIFGVHLIDGRINTFIKKFYSHLKIDEINKCEAQKIIKAVKKRNLTAHKFISMFGFQTGD